MVSVDGIRHLFLGPALGADERTVPLATFDVPRFDKSIAVYAPDPVIWLHLGQSILLVTVLGCALSVVVHSQIVRKRGTALSYCVGVAVTCATALFPYGAIVVLDVRNVVIKFSLCTKVLFLFRTWEAVFGFSPEGVEKSFRSYLLHFALPFELELDRKTRPVAATAGEMADNAIGLTKSFVQIGMTFSLFSSCPFVLYGGRPPASGSLLSPLSYVNVVHLRNCFVIAYTFQLCLVFFGHAMTAVVNLSSGRKVVVPMRNPLLEATSPSDFWGRRWNVMVHGVLKRGVYKPARKLGGSPLLASAAVFAASGLFHEWIIHVMSFGRRNDDVCYTRDLCDGPVLGSNLAFFLWNALIVTMEIVLRKSGVFQKAVGERVPRFAVTFLVVMTSLPVAHWFGDPYIRLGFFHHYQQGFPMLQVTGRERL